MPSDTAVRFLLLLKDASCQRAHSKLLASEFSDLFQEGSQVDAVVLKAMNAAKNKPDAIR